ncbi:unnamed protein product [Prorocentrum cordatum]|uniref:Uncharacterized protein n=1 Tax=Prorocentrum cordatum TaxID=2364126 RepID=A0ABN9RSV1_9DINO|nr:unnamed protein product [Polarella glacialis]
MAAPVAPDTAFLQQLGATIEIATPLLVGRHKQHMKALAAPGRGGSDWKQALVKTTVALLRSEAIRTVDPGRIEKIMTAYVATAYFQEKVPSTSMRETVTKMSPGDAVGGAEPDEDRLVCSPTPPAGSQTGQPGGHKVGDAVDVWSHTRRERVAGRVTTHYANDQFDGNFHCRAGSLRVRTPHGHKYITPELIQTHLRAPADGPEDLPGQAAGPASAARVRQEPGAGSSAGGDTHGVASAAAAVPPQRPGYLQGRRLAEAGPTALELKLSQLVETLEELGDAEGAAKHRERLVAAQQQRRADQAAETAPPSAAAAAPAGGTPTLDSDAEEAAQGSSPDDPLGIGALLAEAAGAAADGPPLMAETASTAPGPDPGRPPAERAPLPMPLPRVDVAARPAQNGRLSDESHWARLRAERPARPRLAYLQDTLLPGWRPAAGPEAMELEFAVHSADATWEDQLWQWFEALAQAGVFVDTYVMDPAKRGEVTGNAHLTPKCTATTPCVKARGIGLTINWFRTTDGRVRLDGAWTQQPTLLEMLRRSHKAYQPGNSEQGRLTGRQMDPVRAAQRTQRTELEQRAQWERHHQDTITVLAAAEIFDGMGLAGVWDVLDREFGVKNVPPSTNLPWALALYQGTLVQIWADGAARVRLGTGPPSAADAVAQVLANQFSGEVRRASDFSVTAAANPIRVRYGVLSERAKQRGGQEQLLNERTAQLEQALATWRPAVAGPWRDCLADLVRRAPGWEDPQAGGLAGRRHLPATAALARRLSRSRAELQRRLPPSPAAMPRPPGTATTAGMLNFGLSGGAEIGGATILPRRWEDIGAVMTALNAAWFFGVSCRCQEGTNLAVALPSFPYTLHGPRAARFGAVTVLVHRGKPDAAAHLPDWSSGPGTCWAQTGAGEYWRGFSIPPRERGANERARADAVRSLFSECDRARAAGRRRHPGAQVYMAGDLNPGDDIDAQVRAAVEQRGLRHMIPEGVATHVRGRRLDVVLAPAAGGCAMVQVHNGKHCRGNGCKGALCRARSEALGSRDLDHHPVTWAAASVEAEAGPDGGALRYDKDPEKWNHEMTAWADGAMATLAGELAARCHQPPWARATSQEAKAALDMAAWAWRTTATLAAAAGDLAWAPPPAAHRRHDADAAEAAAFREVTQAAARHQRAATATSLAALEAARQRLREVRGASARAQRDAARHRMLALLQTSPLAAATVLKEHSAGPPEGLPAIMRDPEEEDRMLVGTEQVLDGARRCILRRDDPPWGGEWDAEHAAAMRARLERQRSEARRALSQWGPEEAYTLAEAGQALRRIRLRAQCRGLPYAILHSTHVGVLESLLHLATLSLRLGRLPGLWLVQDNYHSHKDGKPRVDYGGYRVLALCSAEGRFAEELWGGRGRALLQGGLGALQRSHGSALAI